MAPPTCPPLGKWRNIGHEWLRRCSRGQLEQTSSSPCMGAAGRVSISVASSRLWRRGVLCAAGRPADSATITRRSAGATLTRASSSRLGRRGAARRVAAGSEAAVAGGHGHGPAGTGVSGPGGAGGAAGTGATGVADAVSGVAPIDATAGASAGVSGGGGSDAATGLTRAAGTDGKASRPRRRTRIPSGEAGTPETGGSLTSLRPASFAVQTGPCTGTTAGGGATTGPDADAQADGVGGGGSASGSVAGTAGDGVPLKAVRGGVSTSPAAAVDVPWPVECGDGGAPPVGDCCGLIAPGGGGIASASAADGVASGSGRRSPSSVIVGAGKEGVAAFSRRSSSIAESRRRQRSIVMVSTTPTPMPTTPAAPATAADRVAMRSACTPAVRGARSERSGPTSIVGGAARGSWREGAAHALEPPRGIFCWFRRCFFTVY